MTAYYCPMPWHGGYFTFEEQSVCCTHKGVKNTSPLKYMQSAEVQEIKRRLMSGDLDRDCARCRRTEEQGLFSLKQVFEDNFRHLGTQFVQDMSAPSRPESVEIRLSNLCNFQCRMCGPEASSLISREIDLHPQLARWYGPNIGHKTYDQEFFDELVAMAPGFKRVYFTGGEPMIHKPVLDLIDIMVDRGFSKNIELHLATNCSAINPHVLERFQRFKHTQLTLSIDGVGATAEYQRYGTDWTKVTANVEEIGDLRQQILSGQLSVGLHSAISAYTVLDVDRLVDYYLDLHQRNYFTINVTVVHHQLHPEILPNHLRPIARQSIERALNKLNEFRSKHDYLDRVIEQLENLDLILGQPLSDQKRGYDFVKFTRDLDQARNQDFQKVFGHPLEIDKIFFDK